MSVYDSDGRTPLYHATLTDPDGVEANFIFRQQQRIKNPTTGETYTDLEIASWAFHRNPLSPTALKTSSGGAQYDDLELPFMAREQKDWSGGRGQKRLADDTTRYLDAYAVDTSHAGKSYLAPRARYGRKIRIANDVTLEDHSPFALEGDFKISAFQFTADSAWTGTLTYVYVPLQKVGTPGTLYCEIWTDGSDLPVAKIGASDTLTAGQMVDTLWRTHRFSPTGITLTPGQQYWLVLYDSGAPDEDNYWNILYGGVAAALHAFRPNTGSSWESTTDAACQFRITDSEADIKAHFFDYKRATYALRTTVATSATSELWMNGDRGTADSNSGNLDRLVDATKANGIGYDWANDQWNGCVVLIVAGPGSEEEQPWRVIIDTVVSGGSAYVTVTPSWKTTHTTFTEYVILGSDQWQRVDSTASGTTALPIVATGKPAIAGDYVYFPGGYGVLPYYYRAYNNSSGVWTHQIAQTTDIPYARHFLVIGEELYGALHDPVLSEDTQNYVWRGRHYPVGSGVKADLGEVFPTDLPWDGREITNVTSSKTGDYVKFLLASGFTTGVVAVKNFAEGIDITSGDYLAAKMRLSTTSASGDLKLVLSDQEDLGKIWSPNFAYLEDPASFPASPTNLSKIVDGLTATTQVFATFTTAKRFYLGATRKFKSVAYTFAVANNVNSTATYQYWNGSSWAPLTVSDGTSTGGKTWGQNGTVTFTCPHDWETLSIGGGAAQYWISMVVSVGLLATTEVQEIVVDSAFYQEIDLPAFTANQWQYVVLAHANHAYPLPDESAVRSIGVKFSTDLGQCNFRIQGGIRLLTQVEKTYLPNDITFTGMMAYPDDTGSVRPWVFTDGNPRIIGEDGELIDFPLGEMGALRSEDNGKVNALNDVYAFFTLGGTGGLLEKYYARNLDNVGPEADEGLPQNRVGEISALVSYPNRIFVGMDAGLSGYSSVLMLRDQGYHEIYRSEQAGARVRALHYQAIPGSMSGRIWVSIGKDLVYLMFHPNPLQDAEFEYAFTGHLITSDLDYEMSEVTKVFKSITLISEAPLGGVPYIEVDYRVDNATSWTRLENAQFIRGSQEALLGPPYPRGKNIAFRLKYFSTGINITPVLKAMVVKAYGIVEPKYGYSWTSLISNGVTSRDLMDNPVRVLGSFDTVSEAIEQLDEWAENLIPLTMTSIYSPMNNKTVLLDTLPLQAYDWVDPSPAAVEERIVVSLLANEV